GPRSVPVCGKPPPTPRRCTPPPHRRSAVPTPPRNHGRQTPRRLRPAAPRGCVDVAAGGFRPREGPPRMDDRNQWYPGSTQDLPVFRRLAVIGRWEQSDTREGSPRVHVPARAPTVTSNTRAFPKG